MWKRHHRRHNIHEDEYRQVVHDHIARTQRAWTEIIRPSLVFGESEIVVPSEAIMLVDMGIHDHDASLLNHETEIEGFCNYYFYDPKCGSSWTDVSLAMLNHYHVNEHHWQHWFFYSAAGDGRCYEMPKEAVLEMLADWAGEVYLDETKGAVWHWDGYHAKMKLHPHTEQFISDLLKEHSDW